MDKMKTQASEQRLQPTLYCDNPPLLYDSYSAMNGYLGMTTGSFAVILNSPFVYLPQQVHQLQNLEWYRQQSHQFADWYNFGFEYSLPEFTSNYDLNANMHTYEQQKLFENEDIHAGLSESGAPIDLTSGAMAYPYQGMQFSPRNCIENRGNDIIEKNAWCDLFSGFSPEIRQPALLYQQEFSLVLPPQLNFSSSQPPMQLENIPLYPICNRSNALAPLSVLEMFVSQFAGSNTGADTVQESNLFAHGKNGIGVKNFKISGQKTMANAMCSNLMGVGKDMIRTGGRKAENVEEKINKDEVLKIKVEHD